MRVMNAILSVATFVGVSACCGFMAPPAAPEKPADPAQPQVKAADPQFQEVKANNQPPVPVKVRKHEPPIPLAVLLKWQADWWVKLNPLPDDEFKVEYAKYKDAFKAKHGLLVEGETEIVEFSNRPGDKGTAIMIGLDDRGKALIKVDDVDQLVIPRLRKGQRIRIDGVLDDRDGVTHIVNSTVRVIDQVD